MKNKITIVTIILLIISLSIVYNLLRKPSITLNGSELITINYNSKYKEKGAKAKLGKKDITKKIKIDGQVDTSKIGEYKIKYTVNNHHQKKVVTRTIKVVDKNKPTITLKGGQEISIKLNSKYNDPGYEAFDEYDGDISNKVVTDGLVDTKKEGTYTINYKVKDSSNNEFKITRKINVKKNIDNKIPVLMYHYFYDKTLTDGKNNNYMEIHDFEEQMKYLKENDFYFPTYQELLDFVNEKITLPDKSVIITIDDGQSSFFELAVPIINKYKVKVTSFIIGKNGNKFKNYLSNNITYQSHTYNMHRGGCTGGHGGIFQCINYSEGLDDLKKSIEQLGSSDALAYPYGDINDNTKKITKDAGFKVAFTTKYGYVKPGMDPLELPRVRMSKGVTLKAFKQIVK